MITDVIIAVASGATGAAIAAGVMSIIQYKIKRADTKEDAEDQQSKDIKSLKEDLEHVKGEIKDLKKLHEEDMAKSHENHAAELKAIKDELCVLSYAMLASLDGLTQLHCNGNVTRAHEMLEKHLNQQAHGQR